MPTSVGQTGGRERGGGERKGGERRVGGVGLIEGKRREMEIIFCQNIFKHNSMRRWYSRYCSSEVASMCVDVGMDTFIRLYLCV